MRVLVCAASCLMLHGCGDPPVEPKGDKAAYTHSSRKYQEESKDPKFAEFHEMCQPYHQLQAKVLELNELMASKAASEAQITEWQELSTALDTQRKALNAYTWNQRFKSSDRKVMAWIMSGAS